MTRMRRGSRAHVAFTAAVIVLFIVLSIFFTRPLATKASDSTVRHISDPQFQAWELAWQVHELGINPTNLFNANIFFPNRYTLAYSDHQFANALLAAPILLATGNPMQSANYLLIFQFFLCSLGAYLLVVHLTRNRAAGVIAGIAYSYAPYKLMHIVHLDLVSAAFIPLTLLFLHRYSEERRWYDAALAGLFFVLQTLTTWYYGIILAVSVALFLVIRLIVKRSTFTLKWMLTLAIVFVVALLLVLPFALPYLKLQKINPGFKRGPAEVDTFTADVQDFLVAPKDNWFWGRITSGFRANTLRRGEPAAPDERSIFPGLIVLLLGITGTVFLFVKGKGEERFDRWFYPVLVVFMGIMCLGNTLYFFGHRTGIPMPYRIFYYLVPGFKALRVPPRFDIMIALGLAVLAGFGVKWIMQAISGKGAALTLIVVVAIFALLMVDLASGSLPMEKIPQKSQFPPVYTWLEAQSGKAPTVELPILLLQNSRKWIKQDSQRTYYSVLHWKYILNGYSGFLPQSIYEGAAAWDNFPSQKGVDFFKKEGIRFVIVHGSEIDAATMLKIEQWDARHTDFNLIRRFGSDRVYALPPG